MPIRLLFSCCQYVDIPAYYSVTARKAVSTKLSHAFSFLFFFKVSKSLTFSHKVSRYLFVTSHLMRALVLPRQFSRCDVVITQLSRSLAFSLQLSWYHIVTNHLSDCLVLSGTVLPFLALSRDITPLLAISLTVFKLSCSLEFFRDISSIKAISRALSPFIQNYRPFSQIVLRYLVVNGHFLSKLSPFFANYRVITSLPAISRSILSSTANVTYYLTRAFVLPLELAFSCTFSRCCFWPFLALSLLSFLLSSRCTVWRLFIDSSKSSLKVV